MWSSFPTQFNEYEGLSPKEHDGLLGFRLQKSAARQSCPEHGSASGQFDHRVQAFGKFLGSAYASLQSKLLGSSNSGNRSMAYLLFSSFFPSE